MIPRGFTLIELVIILVIIGILAVSVSPVFFDNSGTQSQAMRLQAMSILRSVQLQAMQDTAPSDRSYQVRVSDSALGTSPYTDDNPLYMDGAEGIRFAPTAVIGFDELGRPTQDCEGGCELTITEASEQSRRIRINKEGFINALE